MKKHYKKAILTVGCMCCFFGLHAQNTINSSSGNGISSDGNMSYVVGKINFIQPQEDSTNLITRLNSPQATASVTAFPNPTVDQLTLTVDRYDWSALSYEIRTLQGVLVSTNNLTGISTNVNVETLPSSTYLINIFNNHNLVSNLTIIKN